MLIPNYIPITSEQYNELLTAGDSDTVVSQAMTWVEGGAIGQVVDIDETDAALADALTDETACQAVFGKTLLCEDPPLLVASPDDVAAMSNALETSTVDEELIESLHTLARFYATAAANNHGVVVLFN